MIIDDYIDVKVYHKSLANYLEEKGYFVPTKIDKNGKEVLDRSKPVKVNVSDLSSGSSIKINVKCDCCDKQTVKTIREYNRNLHDGIYMCSKCSLSSQRVKDVRTANNLKKYGVTNPSKLQDVKEKQRQTMLNKYGANNAMHVQSIVDKMQKTNLERYGNVCSLHGENVSKKVAQSKFVNQTVRTSNQQKYLCGLYNGELNTPCNNFLLDITVGNIDIEYDGGGHKLCVELGQKTEEEFEKHELIRDKMVTSNGYKIMRIISKTDKLPSDEILKSLLKISKQYFNTTDHHWYEWYLDENKFRNADNKDGSFFDFGELRTKHELYKTIEKLELIS